MLFVFFCFCAVLSMLFFLYGKHCGESIAYGLGITINDLDTRIGSYERKSIEDNKEKTKYLKQISDLETLNTDYKKLADTYMAESIRYYDRIKVLEEELDKYKHYLGHECENVYSLVKQEPKKRRGRPKKQNVVEV